MPVGGYLCKVLCFAWLGKVVEVWWKSGGNRVLVFKGLCGVLDCVFEVHGVFFEGCVAVARAFFRGCPQRSMCCLGVFSCSTLMILTPTAFTVWMRRCVFWSKRWAMVFQPLKQAGVSARKYA